MQLLLLGLELSPGLESWFTPLWLVGIGCLIGVLCVSLLWVASGLLSKLDKINMLMEEPKRAFFLALIGGLVLTAIAMPFQLGTVSMPTGGTSEDTILTLLAKFVGFYSIASFIVYSVIVFAWKRTSRELPLVLKEGMLMPIFLLVLTMSAIGLLGTIVAPDTSGIFSSLLNLPTSGVTGFNFEVPGEADLYEGDV